MLYELFAGTLPTGAVQPIDAIRSDLPKRYADAVMRAMAAMPEQRFASLNELLAEIEAPRPKKFRVASFMLIGAGLAAAAAGAFVVLNNQARAPEVPAVANVESDAQVELPSVAVGTDGSTPVEPPPPEETPAQQSAVDAMSETPLPSPPSPSPKRVADAAPAPSSASSAGGGIDARRKECIAQCERDSVAR